MAYQGSERLVTYGKPLAIIGLPAAEQRLEREVCRDGEARGVDQELAGDVEEDEEEVEGAEAEHDVDLGHASLLLCRGRQRLYRA